MNNACITTAADKKYLWGAILLIASLRMHQVKTPVNILTTGLSDEEKKILAQFENTHVYEAPESANCMCTQKPRAMLSSNAEYITWIDSDCIVNGDITEYLTPGDDNIHIRVRDPLENKWVFNSKTMPCPEDGSVPSYILDIWRLDVFERPEPALTRLALTNCITIHKSHLSFISKWNDQMVKVLPTDLQGVVDDSNPAYFMTDESVLNSLLAFSANAPEVGRFLLNKDPDAHVIHFGMNGKPWQRWQKKHLEHFDLVMGIIDWLHEYNYDLPVMPWTLNKKYKSLCYLLAYAYQFGKPIYKHIRYNLSWKL